MINCKPDNPVLQELHPATIFLYLGTVLAGALMFNHPLLLLFLFLAVMVTLISAGGWGWWIAGMKYFLIMILFLFVFNILSNNLGQTVLWRGFYLPLLGYVNVSVEVLVFSLLMSVRLLIVYAAFLLLNLCLNPDRVLAVFGGLLPRSTLLVALATKFIPYLGQQLGRAAEIQQCRGIRYHEGGLIVRAKNRIPLLKVVFLSSLEDSFYVAESLQARAYGSGKRTRYTNLSFNIADMLIVACLLAGAGVIAWSIFTGTGNINYFPRIEGELFSPALFGSGVLTAIFMAVPPVIAWRCRR